MNFLELCDQQLREDLNSYHKKQFSLRVFQPFRFVLSFFSEMRKIIKRVERRAVEFENFNRKVVIVL